VDFRAFLLVMERESPVPRASAILLVKAEAHHRPAKEPS
jgi:hypothetical protein